jgi:predicted DNA-binding transcriptional regulator AlpA
MHPSDLPPHDLLSNRDIRAYLRVSQPTLNTWVKENCFPRPLIIGRRTKRWKRGDVLSFLEQRAGA